MHPLEDGSPAQCDPNNQHGYGCCAPSVGIQRLIVHVVVVLITEYKVNFEEKNSKTNLLYICSKIAMVNSYLSNTL